MDGNSTDGFRKCLEKEFSSIYVFNLRGNARTSGELRQKEAGNVFGGGLRTPIAITLLVKNPCHSERSEESNKEQEMLRSAQHDKVYNKAKIYYHDIGDYHNREEKLAIIKKFGSIANDEMQLKILKPNEHGDWISQRNDLFETFINIADKELKPKEIVFNPVYSRGIATSRV